MEAHVCMRKKVAGYIFPVQLSSRVVLQLLIGRIYKLLDAYTGHAEFFFRSDVFLGPWFLIPGWAAAAQVHGHARSRRRMRVRACRTLGTK